MTAWTLQGVVAASGTFELGPVDLDLAGGESLAVLGESGAGKTTLLRAIAGLVPGARGRVVRAGVDLGSAPAEARRAVYVPPGLALFPDRSVRRNVAYPAELRGAAGARDRVEPLLARFGLAALADRRPGTLSSGEQQRVALARALAARPELLLWDEPLGALDILSRDALLESFEGIRASEDLPLLFVTHDPTLAYSVADRWMVLDRGRVVFLGRPEVLADRPPNRFAARFVGYENVYGLRDLVGSGPFRDFLRDRAGAEGVALTPARATPEAGPGAKASVERVEPTPGGTRVLARCEGLWVRLATEPGETRTIRVGSMLRFDPGQSRAVAVGPPADPRKRGT